MTNKESCRKWRKDHPGYMKKKCREWRAAHPGFTKEQSRKYAETHPGCWAESTRRWRERHPDRSYESVKTYKQSNPEKHQAHTIVRQAIKNGDLVRQPCETCGDPNSQAHHQDYTKPLQVTWLCASHHKQKHQTR